MNISKSSVKVLNIFFDQPDKGLFVNELIRKTGLYPNSVQRSLLTLSDQGILTRKKGLKFTYYSLNHKYPYYSELQNIIKKSPLDSNPHRVWTKILNRVSSYPFTEALYRSNIDNLKQTYGVGVNNLWYNSITYGVYYLQESLVALGKAISNKIDKDISFAKLDIKNCKLACDNLVASSKDFPALDFPAMTDRILSQKIYDFYDLYLKVFPYVTTPHAIERYFGDKIKQELSDQKYYDILISPTDMIDDEQEAALNLASYVKKYGRNKNYRKALHKHYLNYCWMPLWSIHADPLPETYFESEIDNISEKVKDPQKEIIKLKAAQTNKKKALEKALNKIKASGSLTEHVRLIQEYVTLRVYRKNAICKANYYQLPLLYESGNRLGLSDEDVKLLSYPEIMDGLNGKVTKTSLEKLVKKRKSGWAILVINEKMRDVTGVKDIIETMERYQIVSPSNLMQRTVKGKVACSGKATGTVKVITQLSDLNKVEEGDVLVVKMTTPDYVVAIHNAVAIVTDEGGLTCHAAIVSRELNIPCIIGTKNATQILSDGDIVEVDANDGIVRVIENVDLPEDIKKFPGKKIFGGKVIGPARIVLDVADFSKIQEGDILIAPQTTPEYLSPLYRVNGFVVDEESTTSHAVLYGKALRIPSIMGTKFARFAITDGEMVELDATNGTLPKLNFNK